MSEYPEHDRMMAVRDESEQIGDFLTWLQEQGIELARWEHMKECDGASGPFVGDFVSGGRKWRCEGGRMVGHPESNKPGKEGGVCKKCDGTGRIERIEPLLVSTGERIEVLLARRFDIDLNKIEAEKRAMINDLIARRTKGFVPHYNDGLNPERRLHGSTTEESQQ